MYECCPIIQERAVLVVSPHLPVYYPWTQQEPGASIAVHLTKYVDPKKEVHSQYVAKNRLTAYTWYSTVGNVANLICRLHDTVACIPKNQ